MDGWLFWKSLSIGVAVAAPVGPMSLLCIHRTLDHGQPAGLTFGTGIFASVASLATVSQSVIFSAGVFAGSMLWWIILTTLVTKSAALMKPPVIAWINRLSGLVLTGFAVYGLATLA